MAVTDKSLPQNLLEILVVCTGNMCRSPMASAQLRAALQREGIQGVMVSSAGTMSGAGGPASPEAIDTAEEHDLDISYHRTKPLTPEALRRADVVLVMEKTQHVDAVRALDPDALDKTFLLSQFSDGLDKGESVADPIGMPLGYYEMVFVKMAKMIDSLVAELKKRADE
jgi:protein-tyrosine-phosphatase